MRSHERRAHEREKLALAMVLPDGRRAFTRNVCECGMYLVLPRDTRLDAWWVIQVALPGSCLAIRAIAEVIRMEAHPRGLGVALRLHSHDLHARRPGRG